MKAVLPRQYGRVSGNRNPNYESVFTFDTVLPLRWAQCPDQFGKARGDLPSSACHRDSQGSVLKKRRTWIDKIETLLREWQLQYRILAADPSSITC